NGTWSEVGGGLNSTASLIVYRNELYACGLFTGTADGATPLNHLARWNGSAWVQVAGGISANALMFPADDGRGPTIFLLFDGSAFNTAPGYSPTVVSTGLVRFDGVGFTSVAATGSTPLTSIASLELGNSPTVFVGLNNRNLGGGAPGY